MHKTDISREAVVQKEYVMFVNIQWRPVALDTDANLVLMVNRLDTFMQTFLIYL